MNRLKLKSYKLLGKKISCLTAYDASFAKLFDQNEVDIIIVGDSLGNVFKGKEKTQGVNMTDMIYHTSIVSSVCKNSLVIADMPYKSYTNPTQALKNAVRLTNVGAQMVKIEGGREHEAIFKLFQEKGIKVSGHLGLQPQSVVEHGGYRVQGKDDSSAKLILENAKLIESWGVEVIVLECIPKNLAKIISQSLTIPTIGIGAGVHCDGQVLVSYDMLGISIGHIPKFVKNFLIDNNDIVGAVKAFNKAVKNKTFPSDKYSYL